MANNVVVKDAAGNDTTMKTTDNTGVHTPHHNVDASALPTGASTLAEQQDQTTALEAIQAAVEAPLAVVTGDLTDAELRATPVAVAGPLTDTELRATPVDVNITGGASSGTEYTEGATDATITGQAMLWEDAGDTLATVSAANPLPVVVDGVADLSEQQTQTGHLSTMDNNLAQIQTQTVPATEDTAADANPSGPQIMARRRDTLASETTTDGDNTALNATAKGELYVKQTDAVIVQQDSNSLRTGATAVTAKFAKIDAATSGNNEVVAAVTSKKIRVVNIALVASAAVTVRFESAADGTALTGQMNLAANGGFAPGYCPLGHFETVAGEALNLELSGATSVDGWLTYIEV